MQKPLTISVNIIVKNQAKEVSKAIKSVQSFADEVVVIDTGSEDDTQKTCSRLGAQLFFHKWNDNFSEIRNIAIKYSSSDWIFVIDADEIAYFDQSDLPLEAMQNPNVGGINLVIENILGEGEQSSVSQHRYTRLFRRKEGIKFEGRVHEQIRESIENSGLEIVESNIKILHFGYKENDQEKLKRNKKLLEKDLEEGSDDWKLYHLAETEFSSGNFDKAENILEKVIDSPELTELQQNKAKIRLAQIQLGTDKFDQAKSTLDFEASEHDTEGFRKFILAAIELNLGNHKNAHKLYNDKQVSNSKLVDKEKLELGKTATQKIMDITDG